MAAIVANDTIEQGATYQRAFTITNPDNSAFDTTGYSARAELRLATGQLADNFTTSISDNVVTIELTATKTNALGNNTYLYDVEIESSAGIVRRIATITCAVSLGITQA